MRDRQGRGSSAAARSSPLGEWYRFSRFGSDVLRLRPDEAVVRGLLEDVRRPAGPARHSEGRREVLLRQGDGLQHAGRGELKILRLRPPPGLLLEEPQRG